jgi:hypothetical protein
MAKIGGPVINFDTGIEGIISSGFGAGVQDRSETPGYRPTGDQIPQRLAAVLRADSFDDLVRDFVRPAMIDADILSPDRYEAELKKCLGALADDPQRPELAKMRGLLEQEVGLRELLTTYRSLLLQA